MGRHKLSNKNKPTTQRLQKGSPNKKRGRRPKPEHWRAKKRRLALEDQQGNGRDDEDLQAYWYQRECDGNRGRLSRQCQSDEATGSYEGGGESSARGLGQDLRGGRDEATSSDGGNAVDRRQSEDTGLMHWRPSTALQDGDSTTEDFEFGGGGNSFDLGEERGEFLPRSSDERCQLLPDDEKTTDAPTSKRNAREKPNGGSGASAAALSSAQEDCSSSLLLSQRRGKPGKSTREALPAAPARRTSHASPLRPVGC
ncbi:hypothetical protein THAOC_36330, partial [Thalassiosira oceanica]